MIFNFLNFVSSCYDFRRNLSMLRIFLPLSIFDIDKKVISVYFVSMFA